LDTLLTNNEFIPHLANLLLYHVLAGELFAINNLSDGLTVAARTEKIFSLLLPPIAVNGNEVVSDE
jgi:hypothetical protein